jgi:hypothetical protein
LTQSSFTSNKLKCFPYLTKVEKLAKEAWQHSQERFSRPGRKPDTKMSQNYFRGVDRRTNDSAVLLMDFNGPQFQFARKPVPTSHSSTLPSSTSEPDASAHRYSKLKQADELEVSRGGDVFRHWWAECLGFFLVLAAMVAIISTLLPHDGKPMPQWPYQISINISVAIFVNILKFAMILVVAEGLSHRTWAWFRKHRSLHDLAKYDMASRGAVGSVRLIFTLRGRDWISCIGAVLSIGALALDPFAQQLVQHYTCTMEDSSLQATIPRTNMYFEEGFLQLVCPSTIPLDI